MILSYGWKKKKSQGFIEQKLLFQHCALKTKIYIKFA